MADQERTVGFGFEIEDGVTAPLSKMERAYKSFMGGFKKVQTSFVQTNNKLHTSMNKVRKGLTVDNIKKVSKATVKAARVKKFGLLKEFAQAKKHHGWKSRKEKRALSKQKGSEGASFLQKRLAAEKDAIESLGISWKGLASILGGGAFIGFIAMAIKKFNEFSAITSKLNAEFGLTGRAAKAASSTLLGYGRAIGFTKEELKGVVEVGAQFGLLRDSTKKTIREYKQFAKASVALAGATGMSAEAAAQFNAQLIAPEFGLAPRSLRSIGSAFKAITDSTRISADELASFTKGLADTIARLPGMSGEAKAKVTKDFMLMAGVAKDMGIDPADIQRMFAEMSDPLSKEGALMTQEVARLSGKSFDQIQAEIMRGDPTALLKNLVSGFSKFSEKEMRYVTSKESVLSKVLGVNPASMRAMQKGSVAGIDDALKTLRKKLKKEDRAEKAAARRLSALNRITNRIKVLWENILLKIGGPATKLLVSAVKGITEALGPLIKRFEDWIGSFKNSDEWSKKVTETVRNVAIPAFEATEFVVLKLADAIETTYGWWQKFYGWYSKQTEADKDRIKWTGLVAAGMGALTVKVFGFGALLLGGGKLGAKGLLWAVPRMGVLIAKLGAVIAGPVGLVAAAGLAGAAFGRWAAETSGLDDAIQDLFTTTVLKSSEAEASVGKLLTKGSSSRRQLEKLVKLSGQDVSKKGVRRAIGKAARGLESFGPAAISQAMQKLGVSREQADLMAARSGRLAREDRQRQEARLREKAAGKSRVSGPSLPAPVVPLPTTPAAATVTPSAPIVQVSTTADSPEVLSQLRQLNRTMIQFVQSIAAGSSRSQADPLMNNPGFGT